jgi:hypothetical protein
MQALLETLLIPQIPRFDYSAQENVRRSGALRIVFMYSVFDSIEAADAWQVQHGFARDRPVRAFAFGCEAGEVAKRSTETEFGPTYEIGLLGRGYRSWPTSRMPR